MRGLFALAAGMVIGTAAAIALSARAVRHAEAPASADGMPHRSPTADAERSAGAPEDDPSAGGPDA